jgi:hypothetical protein
MADAALIRGVPGGHRDNRVTVLYIGLVFSRGSQLRGYAVMCLSHKAAQLPRRGYKPVTAVTSGRLSPRTNTAAEIQGRSVETKR